MGVQLVNRVMHVKNNGTYGSLDILKGDPGNGVASGGTSGQFLAKRSSSNYDTEWATISTATTLANGLMSSTDKSRLDTLYADYSSALTALGVT